MITVKGGPADKKGLRYSTNVSLLDLHNRNAPGVDFSYPDEELRLLPRQQPSTVLKDAFSSRQYRVRFSSSGRR